MALTQHLEKMMNTDRFTGPLFIIGTGRSGTKLVRDLLNRNPRIGIPTAESAFIPYMVKRFGNPPRFGTNTKDFQEFYKALTRTPFFWYMKREGRVLSKEDLRKVRDRASWSSVFEFIFRFYAPQARDGNFIWGDKTPGPSHFNHMLLLKELFPKAKFLHIVRDPRDVCLSMKKTWGKSLYRAASMWREGIKAARSNGRQLGQDYMEVFYESLLGDPAQVLQNVCDFVDCEFIPEMTRLEKPVEYLGDAKGQTRIVQENKGKYLIQLSSRQIRRIEEIVCLAAQATGYELEHDAEFRPLTPLTLKMLTLHDGWAMIKYDINKKGIWQGLGHFCGALKLYVGMMPR